MDEINEFDEQLAEVLNEVTNIITKELPKLSGPQRAQKSDHVKARLKRAKQVLRSMKVEIRSIPTSEVGRFEMRVKDYEQNIEKLTEDLSWQVASAATESDDAALDKRTAKSLVKETKAVQEDIQESTNRTKIVIEQTVEIGAATHQQLQDQTQRLTEVKDNVDLIESNLRSADRQLRVFLRKLGTDRIFMALTFLVVLGIIGAIVVTVVIPKTKQVASILPSILNFGNSTSS